MFNFPRQLTIALLVLAPIGGAYVRHWISAVFVALVALMLFNARHWLRSLMSDKPAGLIFIFSIGFFLSYLLSAFLNGWDSGSTRMLERELRLLMLAPMMVFLALLPSRKALGIGCLAALLITGALVAYDVLVLREGRDLGIYGPLFTGPACVLFLIGSLAFTLELSNVRWRYACIALTLMTAALVALLTSRSSMLGYIVVLVGITVMDKPHRLFILAIGGTCGLTILGFQLFTEGPGGGSFKLAMSQFQAYFDHEISNTAGFNPAGSTSVGARLEMFKASAYIFIDSPFFGVGPRNFVPEVTALKEAGLINPRMPTYHPHNIFLEALVSKGLLGLSLLLGLLWACTRALLQCSSCDRNLGFILLASTITMMLTESALLIKNNFASLFVLLLATTLSNRLRLKGG